MTGSFAWLLFIAFIPLLIVEDQIIQHKNKLGTGFFSYAFISFLFWNMLSTWWIAYVSFSGMLAITCINGFIMAMVWWLWHGISIQMGKRQGYFSLIVCWLTFEYLHFHWAIQWPWLTLGNGLANKVEWIQWYEYTGVLGGSLWILLINILLFSAYKYGIQNQHYSSLRIVLSGAILLIMPMGYSIYRYHTYQAGSNIVQVSVIQPNIDPYKDKFSGMSALDQTTKLISLAESIVTDSTNYVIAPETSLETIWEDDSLKQYKSFLPLITFINNHPHIKFISGAITQKK